MRIETKCRLQVLSRLSPAGPGQQGMKRGDTASSVSAAPNSAERATCPFFRASCPTPGRRRK